MLKNPSHIRNLTKILTFGLLWAVGGLVYVLLEKAMLGNLNRYPESGAVYNFSYSLFFVPIMAFAGGVYLKSLDVLILNRLVRKEKFITRILVKGTVYAIIIFLINLITSLFLGASILNVGIFHPEVVTGVREFLTSFAYWSIMVYAGFLTILFLFIIEISDNRGPTAFWNFFTGRYHTPRVEYRIFMFLDLNNSTTIAEKLGNIGYYSFLNRFFSDISNKILMSWGSIYQYVGDEIVISWEKKRGEHAIRCFFEMKAVIEELQESYALEFGFIPTFKAGIHGGQVTIGEIGTLKKDILFSGDVLNATARIREMCKDLDAEILISADVLNPVTPQLSDSFKIIDKGVCNLRGKDLTVHLYELQALNRSNSV